MPKATQKKPLACVSSEKTLLKPTKSTKAGQHHLAPGWRCFEIESKNANGDASAATARCPTRMVGKRLGCWLGPKLQEWWRDAITHMPAAISDSGITPHALSVGLGATPPGVTAATRTGV